MIFKLLTEGIFIIWQYLGRYLNKKNFNCYYDLYLLSLFFLPFHISLQMNLFYFGPNLILSLCFYKLEMTWSWTKKFTWNERDRDQKREYSCFQ